MIAVTFALPAESSDFIRLLQNAERSREIRTISGTLHGKAVSVLHTGVGERVTRARIGAFLARQAPRLLISSGFAGALGDQLRVGDLLLAENFSQPELLASARTMFHESAVAGKLKTTAGIADSTTAREELAGMSGALAVDMETEFIAEACARNSIPMLSLRAISDTPAAPFPVPPRVLFDLQRQRTNFASLAFYLVRHPAAVPRLAVFARQISTARRTLTNALDILIQVEL